MSAENISDRPTSPIRFLTDVVTPMTAQTAAAFAEEGKTDLTRLFCDQLIEISQLINEIRQLETKLKDTQPNSPSDSRQSPAPH